MFHACYYFGRRKMILVNWKRLLPFLYNLFFVESRIFFFYFLLSKQNDAAGYRKVNTGLLVYYLSFLIYLLVFSNVTLKYNGFGLISINP